MTKVYYEQGGDLRRIKGKKVAESLHDSGVDVVVPEPLIGRKG